VLFSFRHIFLWLLLLLLPFFSVLAAEKKLDQTRRNLKEIEARIARTAQVLTDKQGQEISLKNDLKTVSRKVEQLAERVSLQQKRLETLAQDMAASEQEIGRQQNASKGLQDQVHRRLAAIYKGADIGMLRAFSSTSSPARMAEDYDYFSRIIRKDRILLTKYRQRLANLKSSRNQLSVLRQEQKQLVAQGRKDRAALKKAAQLKKHLLAKVRRDKAGISAELAELKERAGRLSSLVKKLESIKSQEDTQKSSLFGARKGRLPWPVNGKVKLAFGPGRHTELGTRYDSHGVELSASLNQPVKAIWSGRVAFSSRFNGYGNLLIVDHGDSYFTLYAQAARLEKKVGDLVRQGDVVALAGFDGKKVIYFEIRHRGTPLDPCVWLKSR
jgi:murein hydrolase activator